MLVAAATGTLLFEHKVQADRFGGLPDALWWAIVTLTAVGYGDVVPATVGGKIIGAVVMVSGIAVLALMTGVLASGFAEESGGANIFACGSRSCACRCSPRSASQRYPRS